MIPSSIKERDTGVLAYKYAMECSRLYWLLSDLEQSISKKPEQKAEEEHKVNEYEREEHSRHCLSNCIISSNREGGGRLLHQPDRREREGTRMIGNIRRFPSRR